MVKLKAAIVAVMLAAFTVGGISQPATAARPAAPVKSFPGNPTTFTCPCYWYDNGSETITTGTIPTSASASLTVWKPTLSASGIHSLAELAVSDAAQTQIVEVGWTVDAGVCGSIANSPCLFVYHWVNGASTCYNGCGWSDNAANTTLNAGSKLNASVSGGTTITLRTSLEHLASPTGVCGVASGGVWGVKAYYSTGTSAYIGCFPDTLWSGAVPPATFTTAPKVSAFGEVATNTTGTPTDQMGSGVCGGVATIGTTAFIGSVNHPIGTLATMTWAWTNQAVYELHSVSNSSAYYGGDGSCP